ncbi:protein LIFEGUARD 4-like [Zingiber officinale]|uniref:protein LIFEGUARD 4-like n=1 Tax=Zingiber officinale TaxID=94328 RepID=UPI001C4C679F|nr:protein LIFEGUARD 4-like [Zingiber officinale]
MKNEKPWDVEIGASAGLYPNMMESSELRWGFIRKVYLIVAMQILITIIIAAVMNIVPSIHVFFVSRTSNSIILAFVIMILPLLVMIPMVFLSNRHPVNMILLVLFTICMGMSIGLACSGRQGNVVLEAAALTAIVFMGLTLYTFWAAKRGHDFSFLGPFLFAALLCLTIFSLIQIFFPLGKTTTMVFGCISAIIFSGFIVYDTDNLIKRHSYDEYVPAAISLYLDIINLFLALLSIMEE